MFLLSLLFASVALAAPVAQPSAQAPLDFNCENSNVIHGFTYFRHAERIDEICALKINCTDGPGKYKNHDFGVCPTNAIENRLVGSIWSQNYVATCKSWDDKRVASLTDFANPSPKCSVVKPNDKLLFGVKMSWQVNPDGLHTLLGMTGNTKEMTHDAACASMLDTRGTMAPDCTRQKQPRCALTSTDGLSCLRCDADFVMAKLNNKNVCVPKTLSGKNIASYIPQGQQQPYCLHMLHGHQFKTNGKKWNNIIFTKSCADLSANDIDTVDFSVDGNVLKNKGDVIYAYQGDNGSLRAGSADNWDNTCRIVGDLKELKCEGYAVDGSFYPNTPVSSMSAMSTPEQVSALALRGLELSKF